MTSEHITEAFRLSPLQEGMLFHYFEDPHAGVDIVQLVIHLAEEVDAQRLEAAWGWLIQRHDALRTSFVWEGRQNPQQEVRSEVPVPFVVERARHRSEEQQRAHLNAFLQCDRLEGFDRDRAPMLRLKLFERSAPSFTLVWTFHHAILDGRCFPILLREAFEVYSHLNVGEICARPKPPSYRKYVEWLWEQDFTDGEDLWKEPLARLTAPTTLAVEHPTPANGIGYVQGEAWERIDPASTKRLREPAKASGLTVNLPIECREAPLTFRTQVVPTLWQTKSIEIDGVGAFHSGSGVRFRNDSHKRTFEPAWRLRYSGPSAYTNF